MNESALKQAVRTVREAGLHDQGTVSDTDVAELLETAVLLYARHAMTAEEETDDAKDRLPPPLPPGSGMSATEVLITVTALLEAVNLNVFELGMWQHIGRFRPVNND